MTQAFGSPQDAEDVFYDAFEAHDIEAMMGVWDEAEDIVCVQPMGPVLQGQAAVRDSWEEVFRHRQTPDIEVHHRAWIENEGLAMHVVEEGFTIPGVAQKPPPLIVCNVYRHTQSGWRLVLRQVSPPPPGMQGAPPGVMA